MDPGARSSLIFVFPQRTRSGDAATRPSIDEPPATPTETAHSTGEKHKSLSLSWLSQHRRKDSGISISNRSSKSLRISSPAAAATSRSDRSSLGSRLSRESNRLSADSSKLIIALTGEPAAVTGSPCSLQSPSFPPRRPERPSQGLFDDLLDDVKEVGGEGGEGGETSQRGRADESGEAPVKFQAEDVDCKTEDSHALPPAEVPVTRRSRELLGLAFEAVGVTLPDKRNRLSWISVGSDSSAAADHGPRRQHNKAFSESLAVTHLIGSPSTASSAPKRHKSVASESAGAAAGKQSRPSRWTLTESMADMFKSQRLQKLRPDHDDDSPSTPVEPKKETKEPKKNKVVQRLVTEYPLLADLLGNQTHSEEEASRPEPFRRPDGLRSSSLGPKGPRQRAIPFEIVIPPPPTSVLYRHGSSPVEPTMCPPQQRQWPERHTTKEWADHGVRGRGEGFLAGDHNDSDPDRYVFFAREEGKPVQNGGTDWRAFSSLIPPPKNPARFSMRAPIMPQLPPIPEGIRRSNAERRKSTRPQSWLKPPLVSHQRSRSLGQLGVETEECVYFRSTPFTLTNPAFRHGPITLRKSKMRRGSLPMDNGFLDPAAFQSAIGGVGDLCEVFGPEETAGGTMGEDENEIAEEDEGRIADDMTAWFEEFGFETHGELISAEKPAERNLDRTSWDSACSMGTTVSMPLIIKTDLADSAAEVQQPPRSTATATATAAHRGAAEQEQQEQRLPLDEVDARSLHASSIHDLTIDFTTY